MALQNFSKAHERTLTRDLESLDKLDRKAFITQGPLKIWQRYFADRKIYSLREFFFKKLQTIEYATDGCEDEETACVVTGSSSQITLNPSFFLLNASSRRSTLLHEAFHLLEKSEHVPCQNLLFQDFECDDSILSAYGIEVLYLSILKKASSPQSLYQLLMAKGRINYWPKESRER